jgi:radical SAM-linked protein
MSFGPAISVGYESVCEYSDIYLEDFVKAETVGEKISALDSKLFRLIEAKRIPIFFPSIEACVNAAEYVLEGGLPEGFSQESVARFLELKSAVYERIKPSGEKKSVDARPLVLEALCLSGSGALKLVLAFGPGRNIKPEAVLSLMSGSNVLPERIVRRELFWLDSNGKLEVF